jgi:HTH-type transcriptional regulator, sugar sensing transcriptional regulator
MDIQLLEDIGLTKGEIKVYLTLLKIGETTTGKIIENAEISGGKVYLILDKLIKKGLVSHIIKEKTKYFSAASPNKILEYVKEKEKFLEDKKNKIEAQLPSLYPLLNNSKNKYNTQLYLGYDGIKTAIFEALKNTSKKEPILIMGINLSRDTKYNILWKHWHTERIKKKINCKMLFSHNNSEYFNIFSKMKYTQIKVLKGITPSSVGIVGDQILLTTYGEEPSCLLIKHPEITSSFKTFFETLWNVANIK